MIDGADAECGGGEAACFARLLELDVTDSMLGAALRELADAVVIADADGTTETACSKCPRCIATAERCPSRSP